MKKLPVFLITCFLTTHLLAQYIQTSVLIVGGGASGVTAGIQSARLGVKTIIIEESPWLGGVLTAAAVSTIEHNTELHSGIWGEFKDSLRTRYGGLLGLKTGWASNTHFEPQVGADILKNMVAKESSLRVFTESKFLTIKRINPVKDVVPNVEGGWSVQVKDKKGKTITIDTRILIDATELGDVTKAVGARYRIGTDNPKESGEEDFAVSKTPIVQNMTYVAILKDYGNSDAPAIAKPQGYNPSVFDCSCGKDCNGEKTVGCDRMVDFGKLPNDKYVINWHTAGNHFNTNIIDADEKTRKKAYDEAKKRTLCFIYYMQQELGYKNLGLADEFPTADKLPFMIYHRESRHTEGVAMLNVNHILKPFQQPEPLYRTGVAVSDMPLKAFHSNVKNLPNIFYPKTASFSIPLGSLIPVEIEDFIVADKSISVSNIVSSAIYGQPSLMHIGQAAGVLAAICARENVAARKVSVRRIQEILIQNKAFLMPFIDVKTTHPFFEAIQRVGATGILRGRGEASATASKTWFDPDSVVMMKTFFEAFEPYMNDAAPTVSPAIPENLSNEPTPLTTNEVLDMIWSLAKVMNIEMESYDTIEDFKKTVKFDWATLKLGNFDSNKPMKRAELAVLIDFYMNPFFKKEVDKKGNFR